MWHWKNGMLWCEVSPVVGCTPENSHVKRKCPDKSITRIKFSKDLTSIFQEEFLVLLPAGPLEVELSGQSGM